ncbi:hypothetical protein D9M69_292200 [compost metagenome]
MSCRPPGRRTSISPPMAVRAPCSTPSLSLSRCCVSKPSAWNRWTRARRPRPRAFPNPAWGPRRSRTRPICIAADHQAVTLMSSCRRRDSSRFPASIPMTWTATRGTPWFKASFVARYAVRQRVVRRARGGHTSVGMSFTRNKTSRPCKPVLAPTAAFVTTTSATAMCRVSSAPAGSTTTPPACPPPTAPPVVSRCASTPTCRCRTITPCGPSTGPSRPSC